MTGKCRRSVGFGDCWNLEGNDEGNRDCSEGEVVPVVVAIFRDPGSGSMFRFFGRKNRERKSRENLRKVRVLDVIKENEHPLVVCPPLKGRSASPL